MDCGNVSQNMSRWWIFMMQSIGIWKQEIDNIFVIRPFLFLERGYSIYMSESMMVCKDNILTISKNINNRSDVFFLNFPLNPMGKRIGKSIIAFVMKFYKMVCVIIKSWDAGIIFKFRILDSPKATKGTLKHTSVSIFTLSDYLKKIKYNI